MPNKGSSPLMLFLVRRDGGNGGAMVGVKASDLGFTLSNSDS